MESCINNHNASIINHLDHGTYTNTLSMGYGTDLTNTNWFFACSQACLSGRYTDEWSGPDSFMCTTNDRGAFAMVLNTGYGYGRSGSTAGASQQQNKIFWNYFFDEEEDHQENWQLGKAMQYTKDTFSSVIDSSHASCYVWYGWTLFGDPAQSLRIHAGNTAVRLSNEIPNDISNEINISLIELNVDMTDQDGNLFDWSIETFHSSKPTFSEKLPSPLRSSSM